MTFTACETTVLCIVFAVCGFGIARVGQLICQEIDRRRFERLTKTTRETGYDSY